MSEVALRPMSRDEFHLAIDSGVYPDFERLELLAGQVYQRVTNIPPHAGIIDVISDWLRSTLSPGSFVRIQLPLALAPTSEPEPDIAVIEGRPRDFLREHPLATNTKLVAEVADSSLHQDLNVKLPLYAKAGIPEYWVVDLPRRQILVHRDPDGPAYRRFTTLAATDLIATPWEPGRPVYVRDLLP